MNKNNRFESVNVSERPAKPNKKARASLYNYTEMNDETFLANDEFPTRLNELRTAKNISAREMSLSLGQGAGYINNIENGHNLPSMAMFFEICEYLKITPYEFFRYTRKESPLDEKLSINTQKLDTDTKELLIRLIRKILKE